MATPIETEPDASDPAPLWVVDVRGEDRPDPACWKVLETLLAAADEAHPVLILGDDAQRSRWLKPDGAGRSGSERPGLTWLRDDRLPPPEARRLHLMQVLTIHGIALTDPVEE